MGREARAALAGHELVPLDEPCPHPDLLLLFSPQLGKLPRWLPETPCPSLLLVAPRDELRVSGGLPVDAIRRAPVGFDPELHYPLDPPAFERDFGHPGPPPDDLRAQCTAAGLGSSRFAAGMDEAQKADFLRRTRVTVTSNRELAAQALACGSLPMARPRALSEPERQKELSERGAGLITWREAWDRLLAELPPRGPRRPRRDWWERHVYRSERRLHLREALETVPARGPRSANLRGCVLATLADYEPDQERQNALRDEALECFLEALPLGRLAYLNLGQLYLRRGECEEAVTVLVDAVQPGTPFRLAEFYPRLRNVFTLRWHRYPEQRERLVRWKAWLLMAEHCPPFGHLMARQARLMLPQPADAHWQQALRLRSEPKRQLRLLQAVLEREPLKMEARFVRIRKLWELGRKLDASREYREAKKLLEAFPYLEREPRDLERLWLDVTTGS